MNAFDKTLLGDSPEFRSVIRTAQIVAATDVTVLILGESGTGKELLARATHCESRRRSKPFVAINCAALPEGLAESELFGHRKGAFTGAVGDQAGHIRAAEGGTLFLDEVGELPPAVQAKLLRFLELGECQVVGSAVPQRIDVRIMAATNRDLYARVRSGEFREDLYYRLNVVPIEIPPLRRRTGDLPYLIETLTARLAEQHSLHPPGYARAALALLQGYPWPGNVRELRNFCERMVVLHPGEQICAEHLPQELHRRQGTARVRDFTLPEAGIRLADLEIHMIHQALDKARGNCSKAARLLGLSRDTLLYRMKKYAIAPA